MSFRTIFVLLALIVTAQAFAGVSWGGLADVTIHNSYQKEIKVDVNFVGGCSSCDPMHRDSIMPGHKSKPIKGRGDCLITSVCASIMNDTYDATGNVNDFSLSRPMDPVSCGNPRARRKPDPDECQPFTGLATGSSSITRAFAVVFDVTARDAGYSASCKVVQLRGVGA